MRDAMRTPRVGQQLDLDCPEALLPGGLFGITRPNRVILVIHTDLVARAGVERWWARGAASATGPVRAVGHVTRGCGTYGQMWFVKTHITGSFGQ